MDIITVTGFVGSLALLLGIIRYQAHKSKKATQRIHSLESHNKILEQELNHANTRKEAQTNVDRLSSDDIDSQLQEYGYFRD